MGVLETLFKLLLLLSAMGLLSSGCLQLETPHTFREDEEIRIRAKNLHRYYEELEEAIQLEQYQIKLLQDTLNINVTRGQALAEQIQNTEKEVDRMENDLKILAQEVESLEAKLNAQKEQRKINEGNLKAEQEETAAIQKSIELEAVRMARTRAELHGTTDELARIDASIEAVRTDLAEKQELLEALKQEGVKIEAGLDGLLRKLGYLKQDRFVGDERILTLKTQKLEEVRKYLTEATAGLQNLEKGIEALQQYYDVKKNMDGELKAVEGNTKALLDSVQRIQDLLEEKKGKEGNDG